jgi:hypothetical protein
MKMIYTPPVGAESFLSLQAGTSNIAEFANTKIRKLGCVALGSAAWTFDDPATAFVLAKAASSGKPLAEYCNGRICRGVVSGLTDAFVIDQATRDRIVSRSRRCAEIIKPFLNGRNIRRYLLEPNDEYLIYTYHGVRIKDYPAIETHLKPYRPELEKRATRQEWYELQQPQLRFSEYLDGPKIVFPDIATGPRFAFDRKGFYGSNTVYFIPGKDIFLLGLLNSQLASLYFTTNCAGLEGKNETYLRFFGQYLENFPVPDIELFGKKGAAKHARMVTLVDHMLKLHEKLSAAKPGHGRDVIQRQIDATDAQIDKLVYDLYGLTEDEIKLVEEATAT